MKSSKRSNFILIRIQLATGLFLLLLLWPMFHIILSLNHHFSPWRFAGWGMYSRPYPDEFSSITIFLCPKHSTFCRKEIDPFIQSLDSQGRVSPVFEIYLWDKSEKFIEKKIGRREYSALRPFMQDVFQFSPEHHLPELIKRSFTENEKKLMENSQVIVNLSEQRIDMQKNKLYVKNKKFLIIKI